MPNSVTIDMMFTAVIYLSVRLKSYLESSEILYSTLMKSIASNIYLRGY